MVSTDPRCIPCSFFLRTLKSCFLDPNLSNLTFFRILFDGFMVISSVFPYFLAAFSVLFAIYKKSIRTASIAGLFVINAVVSEFAKILVRQDRPVGSCSNGFGFPSSHASFIVTLIVFLFAEEHLLPNASNRYFLQGESHSLQKKAALLICPFVLYSRYYLIYHSISQIIAGIVIGVLSALFVIKIIIKYIDQTQSLLRQVSDKLKLYNDYQLIGGYQPINPGPKST